MTVETAYEYLFEFTILFLIFYVCAGIYRSCRGPEVCDRIMGINMIGSAVTTTMLVLTALLSEGYLADIAMIYALVNFLSVVILRRVYGYRAEHRAENAKNAKKANVNENGGSEKI